MKTGKIYLIALLFSAMALTISSCGGDDDTGTTGPSEDVLGTMTTSGKYSAMLAAFDKVGLTAQLNASSGMTVLAVSDDQLKIQKIHLDTMGTDRVRSFLTFHLISGTKNVADFSADGYVSSQCTDGPNGEKISIYTRVTGDNVRFNGINYLIKTDATNGVVYEMEQALKIPTVVDHLAYNKNIEIYKSGTNLQSSIKTQITTKINTVFATTQTNFQAFLNDNNSTIASLSPLIREPLLKNSVVEGSVHANLLTGTIKTLGEDITVTSAGGTITLNGKAKVLVSDIQCTNGLIHIIDDVLYDM
jgi:uncharacterized surface protein with fasciclin (FAS1) repeats